MCVRETSSGSSMVRVTTLHLVNDPLQHDLIWWLSLGLQITLADWTITVPFPSGGWWMAIIHQDPTKWNLYDSFLHSQFFNYIHLFREDFHDHLIKKKEKQWFLPTSSSITILVFFTESSPNIVICLLYIFLPLKYMLHGIGTSVCCCEQCMVHNRHLIT